MCRNICSGALWTPTTKPPTVNPGPESRNTDLFRKYVGVMASGSPHLGQNTKGAGARMPEIHPDGHDRPEGPGRKLPRPTLSFTSVIVTTVTITSMIITSLIEGPQVMPAERLGDRASELSGRKTLPLFANYQGQIVPTRGPKARSKTVN